MNTDIILEKLEFNAQHNQLLSTIPGDNVKLDYYIDYVLQQLVFRLKTEIYSRKLPMKEFSYPKNWKEALKERFAPRWFIKFFPIKYIVINITADALYPDLKIKIHENEHFLRFKVLEEGNYKVEYEKKYQI